MLIATIVIAGIAVFVVVPIFYFMIVKRLKKSQYEIPYHHINDNNEHNAQNFYSQNNPPETVSANEQYSEPNVTIETVPESKNPRDHFK
jgi:hypothetical protein